MERQAFTAYRPASSDLRENVSPMNLLLKSILYNIISYDGKLWDIHVIHLIDVKFIFHCHYLVDCLFNLFILFYFISILFHFILILFYHNIEPSNAHMLVLWLNNMNPLEHRCYSAGTDVNVQGFIEMNTENMQKHKYHFRCTGIPFFGEIPSRHGVQPDWHILHVPIEMPHLNWKKNCYCF